MYLIPQAGQASRASSSVCGPTCWPISACRMAGRFNSSCLIICCCSAQAWHRCSSRFWPLTMLARWTVAGFEQSWHFTPRSLLPLPCKAASGPSTLLEFANAVAEASGLLVRLAVDRLGQLLAQLHQLRLRLLVLGLAPRRLAAVLGLAVDVLQQRRQLVAELLVVVRAAEPARIAELDELDAAQG